MFLIRLLYSCYFHALPSATTPHRHLRALAAELVCKLTRDELEKSFLVRKQEFASFFAEQGFSLTPQELDLLGTSFAFRLEPLTWQAGEDQEAEEEEEEEEERNEPSQKALVRDSSPIMQEGFTLSTSGEFEQDVEIAFCDPLKEARRAAMFINGIPRLLKRRHEGRSTMIDLGRFETFTGDAQSFSVVRSMWNSEYCDESGGELNIDQRLAAISTCGAATWTVEVGRARSIARGCATNL